MNAPSQIKAAFNETNFVAGNGNISGYDRLYLTLTDTRLDGIDDIRNVIIRNDGTRTIRLRDIASVEIQEQQPIFLPDGSTRPLNFFCKVNVVPGEIEQRREDPKSDITLTARLEDRDLGSTVSELQKALSKGLNLPSGYSIALRIRPKLMTAIGAILALMPLALGIGLGAQMQQPQLTVEQAAIIQDLYQMSGRLSRLNRNLLLLAKVENGQFDRNDMDVVEVMDSLQPYFENLTGDLTMERDCRVKTLTLKANRTLFESLVSNLVVNAVRHNRPGGTVTVFLDRYRLTVSNTSDEAALNPDRIFGRFYRPSEKTAGNGLGLAIAKAICDWHRWLIDYTYRDGIHSFTVHFDAGGAATGTTPSRG